MLRPATGVNADLSVCQEAFGTLEYIDTTQLTAMIFRDRSSNAHNATEDILLTMNSKNCRFCGGNPRRICRSRYVAAV